MTTIVGYLRRGTNKEIEKFMPIELESMKEAKQKSEEKIKEVLDHFNGVIEVMEVLVEATFNAKCSNMKEAEEIKVRLKLAQMDEKHFNENLEE